MSLKIKSAFMKILKADSTLGMSIGQEFLSSVYYPKVLIYLLPHTLHEAVFFGS
jgi:hypothetical protein